MMPKVGGLERFANPRESAAGELYNNRKTIIIDIVI